MHFIGNRAIVLGPGLEIPQLSYNPGFTAASFFLPIIVLSLAFATVGSDGSFSLVRLAVGGFLSGLGTVGYILIIQFYI